MGGGRGWVGLGVEGGKAGHGGSEVLSCSKADRLCFGVLLFRLSRGARVMGWVGLVG